MNEESKKTDSAKKNRKYVRVTEEQRQLLIDLMSQNEHLTIRDATDMLQIKYESAKAIWTVYKKQGRKHSLTSNSRPVISGPIV